MESDREKELQEQRYRPGWRVRATGAPEMPQEERAHCQERTGHHGGAASGNSREHDPQPDSQAASDPPETPTSFDTTPRPAERARLKPTARGAASGDSREQRLCGDSVGDGRVLRGWRRAGRSAAAGFDDKTAEARQPRFWPTGPPRPDRSWPDCPRRGSRPKSSGRGRTGPGLASVLGCCSGGWVSLLGPPRPGHTSQIDARPPLLRLSVIFALLSQVTVRYRRKYFVFNERLHFIFHFIFNERLMSFNERLMTSPKNGRFSGQEWPE